MSEPSTYRPAHLLVMMLGDAGDVLLATPALRRLRARYPDARITAMTKPATVAVLEPSGLVDAFLPVDKHLFDRPAALLRPRVAWELARFVWRLRRERFDTVVLLHHLVTLWGTLKFALLTLTTGASVRAGLDNGRGFFLSHATRDEGFDGARESDYWLRVVDALPHGCVEGDTGDDPVPIFVITAAAQERADALLREAGIWPGTPILALHPGSGRYSTARRWFPDRFAAVADALAARHGLRVVLLGTEDEHALAAQVAAQMHQPAANLAGQTGLGELGGVLRRCVLLVSNDSGVAHIGGAVGTPVVAVFGPTNHHAWHPPGRSIVVRATPALPCMPCIYRGFGRGYPEGCPPRYCLREVTPAQVIAACEQALASSALDTTARSS